jgi:hypothetical protein
MNIYSVLFASPWFKSDCGIQAERWPLIFRRRQGYGGSNCALGISRLLAPVHLWRATIASHLELVTGAAAGRVGPLRIPRP